MKLKYFIGYLDLAYGAQEWNRANGCCFETSWYFTKRYKFLPWSGIMFKLKVSFFIEFFMWLSFFKKNHYHIIKNYRLKQCWHLAAAKLICLAVGRFGWSAKGNGQNWRPKCYWHLAAAKLICLAVGRFGNGQTGQTGQVGQIGQDQQIIFFLKKLM